MKVCLIFFCTVFGFLLEAQKNNDRERFPNVIVILVDDMGAKDLACYGESVYASPTINRLAHEGVRFENAYSACTVCSPSRAALMTGKYPARLHVTDWIKGHARENPKLLIPDWQMYLDTPEITLAEKLKTKGYATWHVGKWHLGEGDAYLPTRQGFDINIAGSNWGQPKNGYFSPYDMPHLTNGPPGEYLTDRLTEEAITLIKNRDPQLPFYLNLWHYTVHTPIQAKQDKTLKFTSLFGERQAQKNPAYAAMIESLDEGIDRLVGALDSQRILEQTLIIFMSDNGSLDKVSTSNPLRMGKGYAYEGGVRTPLIFYWKDRLPAGKVIQSPVITMDIYHTITRLVGLSDKQADGIDLFPLIEKSLPLRRDLYWHYPHYHLGNPYAAIRSGSWKLIHYFESESSELYNLSQDPGEAQNKAADFPAITKKLQKKLERWQDKIGAQLPRPNPNYDPVKTSKTIF
jgi:arylsulfatase A